ncbi:MAG: spore coat associated protein CotJA [Clostridiales bacterium]|nr:spore coat associated protein CotJA [Clostridiales bacterium]
MFEVLEMHLLNKPGPSEENSDHMGMELAEAFVRPQPLDSIYPPEECLKTGTVFPNLSRIYMGWSKRPCC